MTTSEEPEALVQFSPPRVLQTLGSSASFVYQNVVSPGLGSLKVIRDHLKVELAEAEPWAVQGRGPRILKKTHAALASTGDMSSSEDADVVRDALYEAASKGKYL